MESHVLYAFPFACSLAVHLVLTQHQIPHEIRWVRRGGGRRIAGEDYARVNPKGKVPALVLPGGEVLTENAGVLLYLDEVYGGPRSPEQRRRLIEWLTFVGTELHKQVLAPAFDPELSDAHQLDARQRLLPPVLQHLESHLSQRRTLLGGDAPSGADAYALWGLMLVRHRWPEAIDTPALQAFSRHMRSHAFVEATLSRERQALERHGVGP